MESVHLYKSSAVWGWDYIPGKSVMGSLSLIPPNQPLIAAFRWEILYLSSVFYFSVEFKWFCCPLASLIYPSVLSNFWLIFKMLFVSLYFERKICWCGFVYCVMIELPLNVVLNTRLITALNLSTNMEVAIPCREGFGKASFRKHET